MHRHTQLNVYSMSPVGQSEPAADRGGDVQPDGDFQAVQDYPRSVMTSSTEGKLRSDSFCPTEPSMMKANTSFCRVMSSV